MTQRDWRIFREDFNISTKGGNMPHPIRYWNESGLPSKCLEVIEKVGYKDPTPIQRQAISIQIQNRDIIGIAETGSGKTASFVIPMLVFLSVLPPLNYENAHLGPYALIMAPTRELALQIEEEAKKFCSHMGFTCVSLVGGHTHQEQTTNLRNGAHIVIATPGRLKDCIQQRLVALQQCTYIVMDEADRMMEMGCEDDLNYILNHMPLSNIKPDSEDAENVDKLKKMTGRTLPFRQTVMFSATMPVLVETLAKKFLRRPATVIIGNAGQVVDTIEQRVEFIGEEIRKTQRVQSILNSLQFKPPIIIFVNRKTGCDTLQKAIDQTVLSFYFRLNVGLCMVLNRKSNVKRL
jgi:ATP-dependent RNA helicase DDX23/PRP28